MLPNLGSIEKAVSTLLVFVLLIISAQAANTTNNVDGVENVDGVSIPEIVTMAGVGATFFLSLAQMIVDQKNKMDQIAREEKIRNDEIKAAGEQTELEEKIRREKLQLEEEIRRNEQDKFNKAVELKLLDNPHIMDKALASIEIGYISFIASNLKNSRDMERKFLNGVEGYKIVFKRGGVDINETRLSFTKETIDSDIEKLIVMLRSHFRFNTCGKYFKLGKFLGECDKAMRFKKGNTGDRGKIDFFFWEPRKPALTALIGDEYFKKIQDAFGSSNHLSDDKLTAVFCEIVKSDIRDAALIRKHDEEAKTGGGGGSNTATGSASTIGGSSSSTATGLASTIGGSSSNMATGSSNVMVLSGEAGIHNALLGEYHLVERKYGKPLYKFCGTRYKDYENIFLQWQCLSPSGDYVWDIRGAKSDSLPRSEPWILSNAMSPDGPATKGPQFVPCGDWRIKTNDRMEMATKLIVKESRPGSTDDGDINTIGTKPITIGGGGGGGSDLSEIRCGGTLRKE